MPKDQQSANNIKERTWVNIQSDNVNMAQD